ncbi:hypothetical protein ACTTAL_18830 (plasmid) [Rhodobacter capsulatus]
MQREARLHRAAARDQRLRVKTARLSVIADLEGILRQRGQRAAARDDGDSGQRGRVPGHHLVLSMPGRSRFAPWPSMMSDKIQA